MKITTKKQEPLELNSNKIFIKNIGGYDGDNINETDIASINELFSNIFVFKKLGQETSITESEANNLRSLIGVYSIDDERFYPRLPIKEFFDALGQDYINEYIFGPHGSYEGYIYACYGYVSYDYISTGSFTVAGYSIFVIYQPKNKDEWYYNVIEL